MVVTERVPTGGARMIGYTRFIAFITAVYINTIQKEQTSIDEVCGSAREH